MDTSAVYTWKLEGRVYLWHYLPPVKYLAGWHFHADATACKSLVDLIDRMLGAEENVQKRLPVSVPDRMSVAPGHRWQSASELLLRYPGGEVDEDFWQMELEKEDVLTLVVGSAKLREIRQALLELPHWKDDFALGPEISGNRHEKKAAARRFAAECLWFWTKID